MSFRYIGVLRTDGDMTRKLKKADQQFLKRLGNKVRKTILEDMRYSSLDAFALAHHDEIAKGTLYEICDGSRDMKLSTLRGLSRALGITVQNLIQGG